MANNYTLDFTHDQQSGTAKADVSDSRDGNDIVWNFSGDDSLAGGNGLAVFANSRKPTQEHSNIPQATQQGAELITGLQLVSTTASGAAANGYSDSPVFSPDGRSVVFTSYASNLVAGDTNGVPDLFLKDLTSGAVTRLSTTSSGQANNTSYSPVFSPDGRSVVFASYATLVVGDNNEAADLFLKDLTSGVVTRLSTTSSGGEANNGSDSPVFSPDGRSVVFRSYAKNLVDGDTNRVYDIFLKDLTSGAVTRLSTTSSGGQAKGGSGSPVFSPDGRSVVFQSDATNLVAGDTNGATDLFLKDLTTGTVTRLSTTSSGGEAKGGSYSPVFSPDGRSVVFQSYATNLVAGDTNGAPDFFLKDLTSGAVTRLSTTSSGGEATGGSYTGYSPVFSPDGRSVVFQSDATNLVAGDTNGTSDIFIKELANGSVTRLSTTVGGEQANGGSGGPVFSPDGRSLAFASAATNLVTGDANGAWDVFVRTLPDITRFETIAINGFDYAATPNADKLIVSEQNDRVEGLGGNDTVPASAGRDSLDGGNGNDVLDGGDGSDYLQGGAGTDSLQGGDGYDWLDGGVGNDTLIGSNGSDRLIGGDGNDRLYGENLPKEPVPSFTGFNTLEGGNGNDTLVAGDGDNQMDGGEGNDTLTAGDGNNRMDGGEGNDKLIAGRGVDNLYGGAGADSILAGAGDDTIRGGLGADTLTGGKGRDLFVIAAGDTGADERDVITDFDPTADRFDLTGLNHITWNGSAAFTAAKQVRLSPDFANSRAVLLINLDDNLSTPELQIELTGFFPLNASQFLL